MNVRWVVLFTVATLAAACGVDPAPAGAPTGAQDQGLPFVPPDFGAIDGPTAAGPPSIVTFSPTGGAPGDTVTITGSGFSNTADSDIVYFANQITATLAGVPSDTTLTVLVPTGAVTGPLQVMTPLGTATSAGSFEIIPRPTLIAINPTMIQAPAAPQTLSVTGKDFVSTAVVYLNASGTATPLTTHFMSATTLKADLTGDLLKTGISYTVTLANRAKGAPSNALPLTITNPAPTLSSLTPPSASVGGQPFDLVLAGTGFVPASTVTWTPSGGAGQSLKVTFASSTQISAAVTADLLAVAGSATVQVTSPAPGGGMSTALTLTISACSGAAPSLTGINPTTQATNMTFPLSASGGCFACGGGSQATITLDGAPVTTTIGTCTLGYAGTATANLSNLAAGPHTITVQNPDGKSSLGQTLTITTPNPLPTLSSISPTQMLSGSAGFTLTVTGASFVAASVVQWNGAALATHFGSATQLTADVPAANVATAGSAQVTVVTPAPGGGASSPLPFAIVDGPSITSFNPPSLPAGSMGQTVKILGKNFQTGATATFGGNDRPLTFVSASEVDIALTTVDLSIVGTYPIVVTNPGGGGSTMPAGNFTVTAMIPPPMITSFNPPSLPVGSTMLGVKILGANFLSGASATFNGNSETVTFVSASELDVMLTSADVAAAGTLQVVVTNPGGAVSNVQPFMITPVAPAPVITSIQANTTGSGGTCGMVADGTQWFITVNGMNFDPMATVTFSDNSPLHITGHTPTTISGVLSYLVPPIGNFVTGTVSNPAGPPSNAVVLGVAKSPGAFANATAVFNSACTGCHGGAGGLDLLSNPYMALVGVLAGEAGKGSCSPTLQYVSTTCDPRRNASFLVDKLNLPLNPPMSDPCSGSHMPASGMISPDQFQQIVDWIAVGAPSM